MTDQTNKHLKLVPSHPPFVTLAVAIALAVAEAVTVAVTVAKFSNDYNKQAKVHRCSTQCYCLC